MIENLNTSAKKYSDKKMSFLGSEFENQIFELKKQNRFQLAERYENFWKVSNVHSKRLSMSIENDDMGDFIQDPQQDLNREQTATEGEWVITEPLSRIQSEIQINSSDQNNEGKVFKLFNLEEEGSAVEPYPYPDSKTNTIFYDSSTVQLINRINKVDKVYSNDGEESDLGGE